MANRFGIGWLVAACLVLGALLAFGQKTQAAVTPQSRPMYADIVGSVVDDQSGKPLAGVAVSLLYETVVTDQDGNFTFQKIPIIHTAEVSLRVSTEDGIIIGCTTFDVPVGYYPIAASDGDRVDVQVMEPGAGEIVQLRVKKVDMAGIDKYCNECHIDNPCLETATFKNVVETGKDMKGIIVKESELEAYREKLIKQGLSRETYIRLRYQDTHPDGMNMFEKVTTIGSLAGMFKHTTELNLFEITVDEEEARFVVCDTCHTRHTPTEERQFIVMPFEEDSELCYQCHL